MCLHRKTIVVDSRRVGKSTRRRRHECVRCHERFTTLEFRVLPTESVQSVMNGFEAFRALKNPKAQVPA